MANNILSHQNEKENIKLLLASAVAYNKAKSSEIKINYFLLFLSVAYPICYLFIKNYNITLVLFGCSFLLTLLIQIFSSSYKGNTSRGAIFKEEFDVIIFNLPWKSTLKKPDRREVLHFAQQYKGTEIKDWYSPNLSELIDHNTAVAVLQHSNTSWDIELRSTYRKWLFNFLVFYSIVLSTVFIIKQTDALTIFLLLFSLLSFYTNFISQILGHSAAIEKRESISKHLDEIIRNKKQVETNELRDIQDEIYYTRQEAAKVPNFFFRWYKNQLNSEAEEYISEVNNLYKIKL
jgi:hypothetical protein